MLSNGYQVMAYQLALFGRCPITVSKMNPAFINSRFALVITSELLHPRFERYFAEANNRPLLSRTY